MERDQENKAAEATYHFAEAIRAVGSGAAPTNAPEQPQAISRREFLRRVGNIAGGVKNEKTCPVIIGIKCPLKNGTTVHC
jgi:hypothetical protein